jgi:hypothetical protein
MSVNIPKHPDLSAQCGSVGYLFPPGEPEDLAHGVIAALADREFWSRIQAQALEFIETERSWKRSVARYGGGLPQCLARLGAAPRSRAARRPSTSRNRALHRADKSQGREQFCWPLQTSEERRAVDRQKRI